MINISIDGKKYKLRTEDKDVTLMSFIDFSIMVSSNIPEVLKLYYTQISKSEDPSNEIDLTDYEFVVFYEKVFGFFLTEKLVTTQRLNLDNLLAIYYGQLQHFVLKALFAGTYSNNPVSEFTLKGTKYKLPKRYMQNSVIGEYGEIVDAIGTNSNLQSYYEGIALNKEFGKIENGNIKAYPYILAIMYQPDGEREYNQTQVNERAILFCELTMDIVFGIDFFFWKRTTEYVNNLLFSIRDEYQRKEKKNWIRVDTDIFGFTKRWLKKGYSIGRGLRLWIQQLMHRFTRLLRTYQL